MHWDYASDWRDFEADRVEGTAEVWEADEVETTKYWGVLGFDDLVKVVSDTGTYSNVTPLGGPRIVPLRDTRRRRLPHQ